MGDVDTTVETDFDPANIVPLARTVSGLDSSKIRSEVLLPCNAGLDHCELEERTTDGYYLIPIDAKIHELATKLFYAPKARAGD